MTDPSIRQALLREYLGDKVRCLTCERRCLLAPGESGWCRTRANRDGTLVTLIYGDVSALSANPIEKKPLHHFFPGSVALTAGSWGCNFGCPWCQNWDISKSPLKKGEHISPEDFVKTAINWGCQGTSISFNEPTLSLEWSLDVFRLAREKGLYNNYVSNGYMTTMALDLLSDAGLDAINVDIKGDAQAVKRYCQGIDVEKVWRNCRRAKDLGIHLEITTLVIPGVNDDEEILSAIANRIYNDLGAETPWHLSAYTPAYRFSAPPTPVTLLEGAWRLAHEAGLDYAYLGNVPGHRLENTYCPGCGQLLIERHGLRVTQCRLSDHSCPECGKALPIVN